MAPLAANDVNTWIPPTPANVLAESGFVPNAANVGAWAPKYRMGWNCQTYLSYATAGYSQTYTLEAPVEEKPSGKPAEAKTEKHETKNEKAGK